MQRRESGRIRNHDASRRHRHNGLYRTTRRVHHLDTADIVDDYDEPCSVNDHRRSRHYNDKPCSTNEHGRSCHHDYCTSTVES